MVPLVGLLHGFLGEAADFGAVAAGLAEDGCALFAPDLFADDALCPAQGFAAWSARFNAEAAARGRPTLLIGYSLGGRLALHALAEASSPWAAGLVLSAHPGLEDATERRAWERRWASRFRSEPWESLLPAWNALPVFAGSRPRSLPSEVADAGFRARLAATLERCSPTRHRLDWRRLQGRLTWACGARDAKYRALYAEDPRVDACVELPAGHRLLADAPAEVLALARRCLSSASRCAEEHGTSKAGRGREGTG